MNTVALKAHQLQTNYRSASALSAADTESDSTTPHASPAVASGSGNRLGTLDAQSRHSAMARSGGEEQNSTSTQGDSANAGSSQEASSTVEQSAVNTAIATDSSGIQAVDSAIATDSAGIEAAKSAMMGTLSELASDPEAFHAAMKQSFGDNYDQAKAETIRQQVLEGDFSWMPEIRVVDESVLADQSGTQGAGQGLGAYSAENDTIYISAQLLESDPDMAAQILTEEIGHSLDARLNTSDAAGDEGDIFARIVSGEEISESELTVLRAENDSGTIMVDGKEVEVEYGFFSRIVKSVKGAVKGVINGVRGAIKGVANVYKSVADAFIDLHKVALDSFKKIMESELVGKIMMVAQFVPIPIVQIVARGYNLLKAAYQVGQGIKHGSISAVLGGAASIVGGVGKLGTLVGASSKFVATAAKVSTGLVTAAKAYEVVATGNISAAASLASNYFGGDTNVGKMFDAAGKANNVVESTKSGDYLGAVTGGLSAVQTVAPGVAGNETFQAIQNNVAVISDVVGLVNNGNYGTAAQTVLSNYGDDLGIGTEAQASILEWAGVIEKVDDVRDLVEEKNNAGAMEKAADILGIPLSDSNRQRLGTVFAIRDSVLGNKYANASRQAASLSLQSGNPELAGTFLRLANLLDGKIPAPQIVYNQEQVA